jgi:phage shock protein PspC (stress-responsive transcriptional regulator)
MRATGVDRHADPMSDYTAPQAPQTTHPPRRLTRLREGKMLAGVCTGIARYFDVDPVLVRVGFAVGTLFSGAGFLLYIACWVLMPQE